MEQEMEPQVWQMAMRNNYFAEPLFKAKIVDDDSFIVAFPRGKKVETLDMDLNSINKSYRFGGELQAIERMKLEGRDYVLAGLRNGVIEGMPQQAGTKITLSLEGELEDSNYINDMVDLGNNRLVNCYNSGDLAFWDLTDLSKQNKLISKMPKVHSSFTYKLRRVDERRLVSCGHDGKAVLVDLVRVKKIVDLWHQDSVWCCYPFNENILCSGGLLGELLFWDTRTENVAQFCPLDHEETSFITRLNGHSVAFGDQNDLCFCDLRMFRKSLLCMKPMKTSVQCICVTNYGGIAMGRGGDLCKFVRSEQEIALADRQIAPNQMSNFDRILAFLQRGWVADDEIEEDLIWRDQQEGQEDLFEDEGQDLIQIVEQEQIHIQEQPVPELQPQIEEQQYMELDNDHSSSSSMQQQQSPP